MPKPSPTWKSLERFVAKYLGGERTHWAPEDVRTETFAIEVKHGKKIPKFILKAWEQAVNNSGALLPLLILHAEHTTKEDSLVVLDIKTFRELINERL